MSKRRMIDSEFWEEPKVAKMTDSHRICILGLINEADDEGRLLAEPEHLRSVIWKYHDKTIKWVEAIRNEVCQQLRGFKLYEAEGVEYIELANWLKYQSLRKDRVKKSRYPGSCGQVSTKCQTNDNQMSAQVKLSKDKISVVQPNDNQLVAQQVISYLNEKTGKKFSSRAKPAIEHISARMGEGYTLEQFQRVIDNKVSDWANDPKMSRFLRPSTLFLPTHFDEYLNERPKEDDNEELA